MQLSLCADNGKNSVTNTLLTKSHKTSVFTQAHILEEITSQAHRSSRHSSYGGCLFSKL